MGEGGQAEMWWAKSAPPPLLEQGELNSQIPGGGASATPGPPPSLIATALAESNARHHATLHLLF